MCLTVVEVSILVNLITLFKINTIDYFSIKEFGKVNKKVQEQPLKDKIGERWIRDNLHTTVIYSCAEGSP